MPLTWHHQMNESKQCCFGLRGSSGVEPHPRASRISMSLTLRELRQSADACGRPGEGRNRGLRICRRLRFGFRGRQ